MQRQLLTAALAAAIATPAFAAAPLQPATQADLAEALKLVGRHRTSQGTILNVTLSGDILIGRIDPASPVKLGQEFELKVFHQYLSGKRIRVTRTGRWDDGVMTSVMLNGNIYDPEAPVGGPFVACPEREGDWVFAPGWGWARITKFDKNWEYRTNGLYDASFELWTTSDLKATSLGHPNAWSRLEQGGGGLMGEPGYRNAQVTEARPTAACAVYTLAYSFKSPPAKPGVVKLAVGGKDVISHDVSAYLTPEHQAAPSGVPTSDWNPPTPVTPVPDPEAETPPSAPPPPVAFPPSLPTGPAPKPGTGVLHPAGASAYQNYGVWDFKLDELSQGPDGHWQAVFMARAAAPHRIGMVASEIKLFLINADGEVVANWGDLYKASVTGPSVGLVKLPGTLWMEKGDQARIRVRWDKSRHFQPVKLRMQSTGAGAVVRTFPIN